MKSKIKKLTRWDSSAMYHLLIIRPKNDFYSIKLKKSVIRQVKVKPQAFAQMVVRVTNLIMTLLPTCKTYSEFQLKCEISEGGYNLVKNYWYYES